MSCSHECHMKLCYRKLRETPKYRVFFFFFCYEQYAGMLYKCCRPRSRKKMKASACLVVNFHCKLGSTLPTKSTSTPQQPPPNMSTSSRPVPVLSWGPNSWNQRWNQRDKWFEPTRCEKAFNNATSTSVPNAAGDADKAHATSTHPEHRASSRNMRIC